MKETNLKTKDVVEAGILSSIIVIIALVGLYLPFLASMGIIILPTVITILGIRHNKSICILAILTSILLISLLSSIVTGITFIFMNVISGLTLAHCIKNNKNSVRSIVYVTMAFCIGIGLNIILINYFSPNTIKAMVSENINLFNRTLETYYNLGLSEQNPEILNSIKQVITVENFMAVIPGMIILTSIIVSILNYKFTFDICKKLNMYIPEIKKFTYWHLDNRVTAFIIGTGALGIILDAKNMILGKYMFVSAIIVGEIIFQILGISIIAFFLKKRFKLSNSKITLIIVGTILFSFGSIYIILGIVDSLINFRNLFNKVNSN